MAETLLSRLRNSPSTVIGKRVDVPAPYAPCHIVQLPAPNGNGHTLLLGTVAYPGGKRGQDRPPFNYLVYNHQTRDFRVLLDTFVFSRNVPAFDAFPLNVLTTTGTSLPVAAPTSPRVTGTLTCLYYDYARPDSHAHFWVFTCTSDDATLLPGFRFSCFSVTFPSHRSVAFSSTSVDGTLLWSEQVLAQDLTPPHGPALLTLWNTSSAPSKCASLSLLKVVM